MALPPCQPALALSALQQAGTVPPWWLRALASLDGPNVDVLLSCRHHLEEVTEGPAGPTVIYEHHTDNGEGDLSPRP